MRSKIGAALAATLFWALALVAPAHAAFPGVNGRIVFDRADPYPADQDIYSIAPDGSGEVRLNNAALNDRRPMWSADGRRIAWDNGNAIWLMNGDGGGQTALTARSDALDPAWSPDGTKIAFVRGEDVYIMNSDGTEQHLFGGGFHPAWSPDGSEIASVDPCCGISVSQAEYPFQRRFLQPGFHPAWSPDGERIAFDRDFNIYVMRADGSGQVRVADGGHEPAWSPDGTKIAYSKLTGDPFASIYVMNPDGTGQRKLTSSTRFEEFPDWQPIPRSAFKNAEQFCAALRESMGNDNFNERFGSNGNADNAYGKCVSGK
jgi:TolB protein